MTIHTLRREYHKKLCRDVIRDSKGYPNFADGSNTSSRSIASRIVEQIGFELGNHDIAEQTVGGRFETITKEFIEGSFQLLSHLRPGDWFYSTTQTDLAGFEQYEHLAYIKNIVESDRNLASALGGDYIIKPDIIIARYPVSDDLINLKQRLVEADQITSTLTPLRQINRQASHKLLHASISCKWTIRSDRSQNTRTEALNLIRNRKGNLPHIMAITAEPLPTRIASLALGTGDLDCVYHFALPELERAIEGIQNIDQLDLMLSMIEGRRLRDISDLPFDLAI